MKSEKKIRKKVAKLEKQLKDSIQKITQLENKIMRPVEDIVKIAHQFPQFQQFLEKYPIKSVLCSRKKHVVACSERQNDNTKVVVKFIVHQGKSHKMEDAKREILILTLLKGEPHIIELQDSFYDPFVPLVALVFPYIDSETPKPRLAKFYLKLLLQVQ